jgi:hypothetical protein
MSGTAPSFAHFIHANNLSSLTSIGFERVADTSQLLQQIPPVDLQNKEPTKISPPNSDSNRQCRIRGLCSCSTALSANCKLIFAAYTSDLRGDSCGICTYWWSPQLRIKWIKAEAFMLMKH